MRRTIHGLAVAAVVTLAGGAGSAGDKKDGPKADPPGTPLELVLTGKTVKYTLDTGGLAPEEYKKKVEGMVAADRLPPTAKVDLKVEVKNTSDKPVTVWAKGDPVVLELELKGKGALNVKPRLAFTREFRSPSAVEIGPGKTLDIPVKALVSGFRGASKYSLWTLPGEYELVATLKTGVKPAPEGAKKGMDGFGVVTLTSAPLELTVEKK